MSPKGYDMKDLIGLILMQLPSIVSITAAGAIVYRGEQVWLGIVFLAAGCVMSVSRARID